MLFKRIVITSLLGLATLGCSERPTDGVASPPGGGNSGTTKPGNPGTSNPGNPGTTPGNPGGVVTPPQPPTQLRDITISGPVPLATATDIFEFKVCAGNTCDTWQSAVPEGSYEYTFEVSQWPDNQPISVEGWIASQSTASTRTSHAGGATTTTAQSKYFKTELDTLASIIQMDSSGDGVIDETELVTLSLDPITQAFNTVAKHLLSTSLTQYANLPVRQKNEAVRRYLSEQSNSTWVHLTQDQRTAIYDHMKTTGSSSWRPSYYGSYTLSLTPEQWLLIKGNPNTPLDEQVVEINTAQLKVINPPNHNRAMLNWLFRLTTQQLANARGELVYTQQLVIELAAVYEQMADQGERDLTLDWNQDRKLKEHVAIANPGDGEPTVFDAPFDLVISDSWRDSQYDLLGLYDALDIETGKGAPITWTLSPADIEHIYEQYQQDVAADPDTNPSKYFTLPNTTWPGSGTGLQALGKKILVALAADPKEPIWKHYKAQVGKTVPTYPQMNITADEQIERRHLRSWSNLENANYHHPLKKQIMGLAPEQHLRISGRFPVELEEASVEVVLGTRLNKPKEQDTNGRQPIGRHEPIALIDLDGQRRKTMDYAGKNGFVFTIPLRNVDNNLERCQPGKPPVPNREFEYNYEYTEDEMHDTLTIHIRDNKTGVQLRSVLGSFCELVKRDTNGNGTLEISELERLSVGYISSAQAALMFKTSLSKHGYAGYLYPFTLDEIAARYNAFPRQQVEFLAAIFALQVEGKLFGRSIDLVESADIYMDVLDILDIDMLGNYGVVSSNNLLPDMENLQDRFAAKYAIGEVLINNLDVNVSHITQNMTQLLANSEEDKYYFEFSRPGSWVTVYPVSVLDPTCQVVLNHDQVLGVRIDGKGKNEDGHWVTIGWDKQVGATQYTLGWGSNQFENVVDAEHQKPTNKLRATITGLTFEQAYHIRVQSNIGTPSALLTYSPQHIHIADSRVTAGIESDDSHRGRDSDTACDPLSGKARNSNKDGMLGARYVKLNNDGVPLIRQDLTYKQSPFSCVLDAHTGLVWETKHGRQDDEPYTIFDGDNMFVRDATNAGDVFDGTCALPNLNVVSTDPKQCTVENQITWINSKKRCGLSNWRIPTLEEGYALFDFGRNRASNLDTRYFPNLYFPRMNDSTFHGFWLDAPSMDGLKNRALTAFWLEAKYFNNSDHNPLVLISDGYYAE
ncbi:DUF1566 domain-containing protein [Vibrio penaeicida]|uniref:DUF1566 domain-containing protein n=1 Tax=Vibrio penaeicida TaxID=104609 RepID=A0AAV5NS68_9VIBR|nr:DUF1566 domain-containing protein [Vibrio penaeicida]RTZ23881.1 DUF1566 domain-containing protein [Vibrio penaeicida]GLQ73092.1 hypothetical protein GCM10007932_24520 [Vibrio penaeicida]